MLFMKLSSFAAIIAAFTVSPALAADFDQALAQFQTLATQIDNAQSWINSYNGGVVLALPVANAIYTAHMTAQGAREQLSSLPPLSKDQSQQALDAYNEVHPRLLSALQAGTAKASVFKAAGVGYVAQGMISNLYNEKNRFESVLQSQVDPEYYQDSLAADVDAAFNDTLAAF